MPPMTEPARIPVFDDEPPLEDEGTVEFDDVLVLVSFLV